MRLITLDSCQISGGAILASIGRKVVSRLHTSCDDAPVVV